MRRRSRTAEARARWMPWSIAQERKPGLNFIDDSIWAEVKHINCYATFMGYLWMAMRGLSILVVTWTTVVLLGGFVSMLEKKDFWCLTVITLVQTAGVFNMHLSENLTAIPRLCFGFLHTMKITVTRKGGQARKKQKACMPCLQYVWVRYLCGFVQEFTQGMTFAIILCPLAAIYGFGLYITSAGSVWRLIERDYGNSDGNKNPALYVLYILGLFQGAVFVYSIILGHGGKRIASQVAEEYGFEDHSPVLGYLREIRIGCEKSPSFGRGRNLITYALDQMELESPDDLLLGTRILDTLITYDKSRQGDQLHCRRMPMVTERLIGPSSSGKIFQKLLKAIDSRSPSDLEMTKNAAKIVLSLAGDIRLTQFPEGIESISSLLDASQREVQGYKELMLQGLHIIEKLATDKDNCGVMSNTHGLLGKILNPLSFDILHRVSHDAWPEVVDASLQVLCTWLTTVVGDSRRELHQEISGNQEAISAMQSIVVCDVCPPKRHLLAIKVLITQLYKKEGDKVVEVQLLEIFLHYNEDEYIVGLAGEKLVMLSKESKSNAEIILCGSNRYVQEIESLLSNTDRMSKSRICAAGILEGLCSHYAANNDYFKALKTTLTALMPEVLTQIFPCRFQAHVDIPADALDELPRGPSDEDLDRVQPISYEVLQTLQRELLGEVLQTLLHELLQKLSPEVLRELSPEVLLHELLQKLCTEVVQTFLHEFLQKLPHRLLQQISLEGLQTLLDELLHEIPYEFLHELPHELREKLSPQGLRTFPHEFQQKFSTEVLQTLHSHEFLQTCPREFLEKLSPEVLQTFPHESLQKLSAEVLQTFPLEFLQKIPHELLQKLPHDLQMAINAENAVRYKANKLQVALLSLWLMIYDKLIIPDHDLPLLLTEIKSHDPGFNLPRRLMEMVDVNSDPKAVDCLRILMLVAKMTILMIRHIHIYDVSDLKSLIASLKKASRIMINLDAFVHLSGGDGGDSLGSLVQEAHEFFGPSTFEPSGPSTYDHGQSSTS